MKLFDVFKRKKLNKLKLGLALGGGSARGIAYIGMFRAFEQLGIKFDYVAGTSVGSILGAMYAYGKTANEMQSFFEGLTEKDIKGNKFLFFPSSTNSLQETVIKAFGEDIVFSDLKMPFVAVATNLKTGNEVRISSGSVAKAVAASSCIPGVFVPVDYNEKSLIDGGVLNSVPVDALIEYDLDYIVAIDLNSTRGKGTDSSKLTSILSSTFGMLMQQNVKDNLPLADIVLLPNLKDYKSTSFENANEMIAEGYRCVMASSDLLLKIYKIKRKKRSKICYKNLEKI